MAENLCQMHTAYPGNRAPRTQCIWCWRYYIALVDEKGFKKPMQKRGKRGGPRSPELRPQPGATEGPIVEG